MWKLLSIVLLFVLGIIASAQVAETYVEIYQPMVAVRSGPSVQYSHRASMWSWDRLTVTGKSVFDGSQPCTDDLDYDNDLWLRVDVQGIEGWVNYCVVKVTGDLDGLPVAEPAFPENDEWLELAEIPNGIFFTRIVDRLGTQPEQPFVIGLTRTRNYIQLREQPSLGTPILDHISSDKVYVTGISANGVWVRVEYDAKLTSCLQVADSTDDCPYERISGWVAKYLLSFPPDWQATFAEAS